jgi:carbon monoxide dehydrogenase subunit G
MDTDGPQVVGAKCITTRRIGFMQREVTAEVTNVEPPRRWGVRGVDGPIRATVDVVVEPTDEGRTCRLTISIAFNGNGIGKLLVPLVIERQARSEMPANLKRLKERVEKAAANRGDGQPS